MKIPLRLTEATTMAFEVPVSHNLQMDCARKSVKISLDSEDSNWSDEFKKVPLHLKILRKIQMFDFPEAIF